MQYRITKEHVWVGTIDDRPGGLAAKLQALADGGLNLELIIGRRDWSGTGLMFISPLRTLEELDVAERAGLSKDHSMLTLRITGPNRPGLVASMVAALGAGGLNLRGVSAAALGEQSVTNIAFDNDADTDRARALLERALANG